MKISLISVMENIWKIYRRIIWFHYNAALYFFYVSEFAEKMNMSYNKTCKCNASYKTRREIKYGFIL